ncbi:15004_t:CDS:2 [Racocetra fulgida]|uniref:15004_t:CDS:1 n=1 Tax=Racocetra fulgida TaxID=60492 RepID=A0A9N9BZ63_9GLOM|nr:15004_t:CDS:2 [Racocetra fulgida]
MIPYKGFDRRRCWRKQMALRAEAADDDDADLEEQATTMAKRLQWQIDGEIGELEAEIHKKMTEFQGLTFAQWFDFSIRKYFLRQVKSMDNISASGDKKANAPEKPNDALLALYGHILASARSYIGAIVARFKINDINYNLSGYYARAYAENPKDPVISLSIGLAYLHRAMQRQTDNRHLQIMQGFTFLYNYYELKARNQEAEYNLGRAFHQLAVPHYKKALELPSLQKVLREQEKGNNNISEIIDEDDPTDLKKEAAYNLSLICIESGSVGLAANLLKKYCTI